MFYINIVNGIPFMGSPWGPSFDQGNTQRFAQSSWMPQPAVGGGGLFGMRASPSEGIVPGNNPSATRDFGQAPNNVIPSGPVIIPGMGAFPGPGSPWF